MMEIEGVESARGRVRRRATGGRYKCKVKGGKGQEVKRRGRKNGKV